MFKVIFMAAFISVNCTWVLKSSHNNIIPNLTEEVTLQCLSDNLGNSELAMGQLTRIRILKQIDSGAWEPLAEIAVPNTSFVNLSQVMNADIVASGHLGATGDSFLSVTWSIASEDVVGIYSCEVDGFGEKIRSDVHQSTKTVNITSMVPTTRDLVDVILKMKKHIKSEIEDNFLEVRYWPSGNYTLLSPISGCPDTQYSKMVRGFAKVTTETNKKPNHSLSHPHHLHSDIFERCDTRNIIHFKFCNNLDHSGHGIPWPKGSYCIHNYDYPNCPPDFIRGYFYALLESSVKYIGVRENTVDAMYINPENIAIVYCCRNDGDPDIPVLLPTGKPFYLYRYKGKCQKVRNMVVSEEWMHIDTDDTKKDHSTPHKPDSTLNDVTVEMCYYTKEKE